jgi:hypothetical protein
MSFTLTVRDESVGGEPAHEQTLEFPVERMTARELIRGRVYQEVQDYNRSQQGAFRGLVRPVEEETALNGPRSGRPRPIDWKKQFDRAVEAFEANQVLLLVDDRQVESLDEEVELRQGSVATFLRLSLLVGG